MRLVGDRNAGTLHRDTSVGVDEHEQYSIVSTAWHGGMALNGVAPLLHQTGWIRQYDTSGRNDYRIRVSDGRKGRPTDMESQTSLHLL